MVPGLPVVPALPGADDDPCVGFSVGVSSCPETQSGRSSADSNRSRTAVSHSSSPPGRSRVVATTVIIANSHARRSPDQSVSSVGRPAALAGRAAGRHTARRLPSCDRTLPRRSGPRRGRARGRPRITRACAPGRRDGGPPAGATASARLRSSRAAAFPLCPRSCVRRCGRPPAQHPRSWVLSVLRRRHRGRGRTCPRTGPGRRSQGPEGTGGHPVRASSSTAPTCGATTPSTASTATTWSRARGPLAQARSPATPCPRPRASTAAATATVGVGRSGRWLQGGEPPLSGGKCAGWTQLVGYPMSRSHSSGEADP